MRKELQTSDRKVQLIRSRSRQSLGSVLAPALAGAPRPPAGPAPATRREVRRRKHARAADVERLRETFDRRAS